MTRSAKATVRPFKVPVIDITRWEMGSARYRAAIAAQVDAAASNIGFMQFTGHGVPESAIHGLGLALDSFFDQPLPAKRAAQGPSAGIARGYSPPSTERPAYSLGARSPGDLFEAFTVGTQASDHRDRALPATDYPENIWPVGLPRFRPQVMTWFEAAQNVARRLTRIFAVSLDLPEGFFHTYTGHSLDALRLSSGPVVPDDPAEPDRPAMGAHTDFGILTVLWSDPVNALQIMDHEGRWQNVLPEPGALVVNLGDLMARWTNDRWVSAVHRVASPTDTRGHAARRRSAAFFHGGNFDALVTALPSCVDSAHPAKYPPVTIAGHISQSRGGLDAAGPKISRSRRW
ncbi:isopenicillin N synthase family dioxygenase [Nocardiopsis ansamitocini]|uniref:2OG-Fe(II) oxygenase n=1 Tax=Nocardiopsis ansamitocini TaxID=1670832 RepID=A0A9W6P325_9ACTN|nr:2OG-Fe(II) oxygenase family protein [Nocardiopsis ansamitocini]GLU46177.1 2OG-Fe(II) oxygenase [Nocardiopsis ansamitocini]